MRRVIPVVVAAVILLAGCANADASVDPTTSPSGSTGAPTDVPPPIDNEAALDLVTVKYDDDGVPAITLAGDVHVDGGAARLISDGDGAALSNFNRLLLDTLLVDGASGAELASSYTGEYPPMRIPNDPLILPSELHDVLKDAHLGARVLWVIPKQQGNGSDVYAFNIGEGWNAVAHATGEPVEPIAGLPTVSIDADYVPTISVPRTAAPAELIVQPLIVGGGPEVEAGHVVRMQYVLHTWDDGELRQSSWETQPFDTAIGVGSLIQAWDEGLIGHTVGSQVLIVAPPEFAYGTEGSTHELKDETLVFVVDILDVIDG